jgi:hypothetical protein
MLLVECARCETRFYPVMREDGAPPSVPSRNTVVVEPLPTVTGPPPATARDEPTPAPAAAPIPTSPWPDRPKRRRKKKSFDWAPFAIVGLVVLVTLILGGVGYWILKANGLFEPSKPPVVAQNPVVVPPPMPAPFVPPAPMPQPAPGPLPAPPMPTPPGSTVDLGGQPPGAVAPIPPSGAKQPDTGWREVVSREGGFRVQLPASPDNRKERVRVLDVPLELKGPFVKTREGAWGALFADLTLPGDTPPERTERFADVILDAVVSGLLGQPGVTLAQERKLRLGDVFGRELLLTHPEFGRTVARIIVVDYRRAYYLWAAAPPDQAARFFDSFQLSR